MSRMRRPVALASVSTCCIGTGGAAPDKRHPKTDVAAQEGWEIFAPCGSD